MSNITSQMTIDYNAIIDELIGKGDNKECRKRIEELSDEFNGLETGEFLREHRTIGFHNTRQTGKTAWVNEQFINRPGEVSIVTVNEGSRCNDPRQKHRQEQILYSDRHRRLRWRPSELCTTNL
jgi:hypothetical protein